jgi:hypothetical protein
MVYLKWRGGVRVKRGARERPVQSVIIRRPRTVALRLSDPLKGRAVVLDRRVARGGRCRCKRKRRMRKKILSRTRRWQGEARLNTH